jgi:hypothetical protein
MNVLKVAHRRKNSILTAERVTITVLRGISGAGVMDKWLKNRQAVATKQKRTINDRTVDAFRVKSEQEQSFFGSSLKYDGIIGTKTSCEFII